MKYMRISEFTKEYPVSRTRLYELFNQKKIKAKKLGGQTLVDCESADNYFATLPAYKGQKDKGAI